MCKETSDWLSFHKHTKNITLHVLLQLMQSLSNTLSLTFSQPINIVVEHHSEMKSLSTLDVCSPPSPVAQSMSPSTVGHTLSNWTPIGTLTRVQLSHASDGCTLDTSSTEFPIPSCVRFRHVLFWEFPCPAWAVASSCSSSPQAGGTP